VNRTTVRRIAGWTVLSIIPAVLVTLAALAGQLAELAVGVGFAAVLSLAAWVGVALLSGGRQS
jgi:hypothetical protein